MVSGYTRQTPPGHLFRFCAQFVEIIWGRAAHYWFRIAVAGPGQLGLALAGAERLILTGFTLWDIRLKVTIAGFPWMHLFRLLLVVAASSCLQLAESDWLGMTSLYSGSGSVSSVLGFTLSAIFGFTSA